MMQSIHSAALQYLKAGKRRQSYGYGSSDLLHPERHMQVKTAHLSQNVVISRADHYTWHKILPETEAIVFVEGLLDVIVPIQSSSTTLVLERMPIGRDLLAIPAGCLFELLSRHSTVILPDRRIGSEAYWQCEKLFENSILSSNPHEEDPF